MRHEVRVLLVDLIKLSREVVLQRYAVVLVSSFISCYLIVHIQAVILCKINSFLVSLQ